MKAIQVDAPGAEFKLVVKEIPEPKQNEVLIKVEACGICHGDSIVKEGHFPGLKYPRIPGHEVIGIIAKLGSNSKEWKIGQRVGVGWHGGHCGTCNNCRRGDFGACENALTTGLNMDGGYAEYMIARTEVLHDIPKELKSEEAAPILCAGSTVFGALKSSSAKGGDIVAIQGLGGLGHLAVQFAVKLGFKTVVVSRGKEKEKLAKKLGAHYYFESENAANELTKLGGAKLILCTAPSSKAMQDMLPGLGRNGQMIIVSFANEPMQISPSVLMRGVRSISGWVGGNPADALAFSVITGVVPMIETYPLEQAAIAYDRMMTAKVHFRSVLKM
jgi:D-arabinose 1-dehydrogenase-like Zn-dependent alcohol dehydrogenase